MDMRVSALLAEVPDIAGHEVRRLLAAATGMTTAATIGDPLVGEREAALFRGYVRRRRLGEPLQYIEGTASFGPLELAIDSRALIPRPETERLWEIAVGLISGTAAPVIVDLCTGSGNLALACKLAFPTATVVGVDSSPAALELAEENSRRTGLAVEFRRGDLFAGLSPALRGVVDLLISNPPYVATAELADLPSEVKDYEPRDALLAGPAGTEILQRIAAEAGEWLRPGGVIACEIGESHGEACRSLFADLEPRIERDLSGKVRYLLGRAPTESNLH